MKVEEIGDRALDIYKKGPGDLNAAYITAIIEYLKERDDEGS